MELLNPAFLIQTFGTLGLAAIVFAESGLFFGFFLPGDSLLFTAGIFAAAGHLNIFILLPVLFIAAALGDNVGYAFGKKTGPMIFSKEDSFFFHKEHLARAEKFFETYGKKSIVLARFVPIVRTFTPIFAGVGNMKYRTFFIYNIIGAFLWAVGVTLLGFLLGNIIPDIEHYLLPIIAVIIVFSFAPIVFELLRARGKKTLN